jgi:hypothetical protein
VPDLWRNVRVGTGHEQREIPLLRFIFYSGHEMGLTTEQWAANLQDIDRLLHIFANDFCDRGEYNAYKHSLGHIHCGLVFQIGPDGGPLHTLGQSDDTTIYLERGGHPVNNPNSGHDCWQTYRASKFFDFERDHLCCSVIHQMISNMIVCRKYRFVKPPPENKSELWLAFDIPFDKIGIPNTGVTRFTISA